MKHLIYAVILFIACCLGKATATVTIIEPFPDNVVALVGTRATTTCTAMGQAEPPALVKFVIRDMFANVNDIPNTKTVYQTRVTKGNTTSVTLHFDNISVSDKAGIDKTYKCQAYSNASKKYPDDDRQIQVFVILYDELPKISYTSAMNATRGSDATLNCSVTDPGMTHTFTFKEFKWIKNGNELKRAPPAPFVPLILKYVRATDGGEYRCAVQVGIDGNDNFNYNITGEPIQVNVPAYLTKGHQEIEATIGSNVTLECSAEGYPINVVWLKISAENKEVEIGTIDNLSPHVNFRHECSTCHFKMDLINVREGFEGKYICRTVNNTIGKVEQQFTLLISETPSSSSAAVTASWLIVLVFCFFASLNELDLNEPSTDKKKLAIGFTKK